MKNTATVNEAESRPSRLQCHGLWPGLEYGDASPRLPAHARLRNKGALWAGAGASRHCWTWTRSAAHVATRKIRE